MFRIAHIVLPVSLFVLCSQGCAHFVETQAINRFTKALEAENLADLKLTTSGEFERKALRLNESVHDLKIINLPEGKASVIKVDDKSESEKLVTVTVGEAKRKLFYKLTREGDDEDWVVDDVVVKQKRKDITAARSVTDQMDLLLSVREFLAAWNKGKRSEVLRVATPEFREVLEELPPAFITRMAKETASKNSLDRDFRPRANLDEDVAVVRLRRSAGEMVLSMEIVDGSWKVADVAIESKSDKSHIPSVRKSAGVMRNVISFLKAYENSESKQLASLCTKRFFEGSLAHADTSAVTLPTASRLSDDYELKMMGRRADFVIPAENEVIRISLVVPNDDDPTEIGNATDNSEDESDASRQYLIEDVTIFELESQQEKRLSALFTAHAMMQIFQDAVSRGDLTMLRKSSTPDFNNRVWADVDNSILSQLPLKQMRHAPPKIVSTVFDGAVTEVTVTQHDRAMTYVLRDHAGRVRVDDVLIPVVGRPNSLKQTLEVMLPVLQFAGGLHQSRIGQLQRMSSNDFNRFVWKQVNQVPGTGFAAVKYLQESLRSIEFENANVIVNLGDYQFGAKVTLVREHDRYVVDDVVMIAGREPRQQAKLKQMIRVQIANGTVRPQFQAVPRTPTPQQSPIQPVGYQPPAQSSFRVGASSNAASPSVNPFASDFGHQPEPAFR